MKPVVVIICCSVALAWLHGASIAEGTIDLALSAEGAATNISHFSEHDDADTSLLIGDDNGFVTSDQKIPVPEEVAQAKVGKGPEDRAVHTGQRTVELEKDGTQSKVMRRSEARRVTL